MEEILRILDEMLEILNTPVPKATCVHDSDDGATAIATVLYLRRLYLDAHGLPPTHINVTPEVEADLLMTRTFGAFEWMTTEPQIYKFGMRFCLNDPGRKPFEMWRETNQ